jgi:ABC-type polysaccharide transport system permease subunit
MFKLYHILTIFSEYRQVFFLFLFGSEFQIFKNQYHIYSTTALLAAQRNTFNACENSGTSRLTRPVDLAVMMAAIRQCIFSPTIGLGDAAPFISPF